MGKQPAVMETSFWVLGHRIDILSYLTRFFTIFVPQAVRVEILASDPRYPQRIYGYQEMFHLLETQGLLSPCKPTRRLSQFHAGEAAALAMALEKEWWLLINEQRALSFARQQAIKAVTVPEFIVYLYDRHILSYRSALAKLEGIAANTGQQVMHAAQGALSALAQSRRESQ